MARFGDLAVPLQQELMQVNGLNLVVTAQVVADTGPLTVLVQHLRPVMGAERERHIVGPRN